MADYRTGEKEIFGIMAEFDSPDLIIKAARRVREEGYTKVDAFSPFPIEELSEEVGFHHTGLPVIVFVGGLIGALVGFGLQYWVSVIQYPLNVGGRPFNSWPAFIPVTFEMTILFAALSAVLGMIALNRLPMPYHPVFNVPRFNLASQDRFFLLIEKSDPKFHLLDTRSFLESLGAHGVTEVDL
jgi:hypothetical protein